MTRKSKFKYFEVKWKACFIIFKGFATAENCCRTESVCLKSGIKNSIEVTLKSSRNVVEDTNNAINFPHQLLLTNAQVLMLHKALANASSANTKLLRAQLYKIGESGQFLERSFTKNWFFFNNY